MDDVRPNDLMGLSDDEYDQRVHLIGRAPNRTELGIFSVMWSEHCSYKSSKRVLATLPTTGTRVIEGPGENAGIVDIGDGQAAAFKIESHNHPSYIEPVQGAATGVGGILRDVFTMGARPVAILNALRFGDPSHPRTRHLVAGVVEGIGHYGNCIGVPTVGGECQFDPSYNGNILVNAQVFLHDAANVDDVLNASSQVDGNDGNDEPGQQQARCCGVFTERRRALAHLGVGGARAWGVCDGVAVFVAVEQFAQTGTGDLPFPAQVDPQSGAFSKLCGRAHVQALWHLHFEHVVDRAPQ